MAEQSKESFLPRVETHDLERVLFEDITDPTHEARWNTFAALQPSLARELLKRAYVDTYTSIGSVAMQKVVLDVFTLAYSALELAATRQHDTQTIVGVDVLDPPL